MSFSFNLETWFNVTAHSLPKGTMWVKYEPDWGKGREDMLRTRDLGRTDGHTDYFKAPTERGPNNILCNNTYKCK